VWRCRQAGSRGIRGTLVGCHMEGVFRNVLFHFKFNPIYLHALYTASRVLIYP